MKKKSEEEFTAKLLAIFKDEAKEHLEIISKGLISLESRPPIQQQDKLVDQLYRETHNLKGSAKAVGNENIHKICQSIENIFAAYKKEELVFTALIFNTIFAAVDHINLLVNSAEGNLDQALIDKLNQLSNTKNELLKKPEESSTTIVNESEKFTETAGSLRISTKKLDQLFQQVEELLHIKITAKQQAVNLQNTEELLKQWQKRTKILEKEANLFEKKISDSNKEIRESATPILNCFDQQNEIFQSLRKQINTLNINGLENIRQAYGMIDNLLLEMKKLLMQPIANLFDTLPRMTRDIARELNKDVFLEFHGGQIEADRRILDEMKNPLFHIIRNCIDHGVGTPEERSKDGKPAQGKISIVARQIKGNNVELVISDDGKGIDIDKIKQSAIEHHFLNKDEAANLNENEALNLIFFSGITTSPIATDISGRGLGLKIVAETVVKLNGSITVKSKWGVGTTFIITLPLSIATFHGIHIKAENQDFMVPISAVKKAMRILPDNIKTIEGRQTITYENLTIPYFSLSTVLQIPKIYSQEDLAKIVLIINATDTTVAFEIDCVLQEQELIIKNLGNQLKRIKNFMAATILEEGKVVLIIDPTDLIHSALKIPSVLTHPISNIALMRNQDKKRTILLVEDSITTRTLLKNVLEASGYEVKTAINGFEGFSILQESSIRLLVTDIEMPILNGLELAKKVRSLKQYSKLPIVIISTRGSQRDIEQGIEVGANAYINKSNFEISSFVQLINQLLEKDEGND